MKRSRVGMRKLSSASQRGRARRRGQARARKPAGSKPEKTERSSKPSGETARLRRTERQLKQEIEERKRAQEALEQHMEELRAAEERLEEQNRELQARRAEVEEERERYEELFDFAPDAYLVTDLRGHIRRVNRAGCRLFNGGERYLLRMPLAYFIAQEDKPALLKLLSDFRQKASREWRSVEVRVRPTRKEPIVCALTVNAVKDSAEGITGLRWLVRDITESKRAQEKLRDSEEQFRAMFAVSSVGKGQADAATGRFLRVNAALCRITGYSEEELLARTVKDITHPEDWERDLPQYSRMLSGKAAGYEAEKRYVRRDGQTVWVRVSVNLIRDAAGRPARTTGVVEDITERKRAEEALRHYEERFSKAFGASPVGLVISQLEDGRLVEVNEAFLKVLGYSREELLGRTAEETRLIRLEDRAAFRDALEGGKAVTREILLRCKDGRERSVLASAECMQAGSERLIVWTGFDITERKSAEQALRESQARLAQAVRVGRLGTFDHDHVRDVIEASADAYEIFGFKPGERLTFRMVMERVVPEDRERVAAAVARAQDPGGNGMYETEHRVLAGGHGSRWVSIRAQSFFEGEGKRRRLVRTIGAVLDVTEQKELEVRLERLVRERTAKLQELVSELEHFSYSITHDMRAPLRGMQGFATLMASACTGCEKQDPQTFLQRILVSAGRMDALITDALNYNKAVRQELALEPVEPGPLLRGMLDSYPELQPAKADIEIRGQIPLVMANQAGLTQCFSNLLGNAVKFVRPGQKPEIKIWAESVNFGIQNPKSETEWVRIWVEDKGIGIPASMLPRVFNMFSRGQSSYQGTGIGLALVRKVTERMGGRVGVESEEGKGSRFWMELKAVTR